MRKLKRNDVVIEAKVDSFRFYGRVWRRIDDDHVQVVMCGHHVRIYRDVDLILTDYKGVYKRHRYPGNDYNNPVRWDLMPTLRKLKKYCSKYDAHFGGYSDWKRRRWTKEEVDLALSDREIYNG